MDKEILKNLNIRVQTMGGVEDGWTIYPTRSTFVVYSASCLYLYFIYQTSFQVNCILALLCLTYYDWFSGVLHVVLDDERNLKGWRALALKQSCLEFQWHHKIPSDIVQKSLVQACADLNIVIIFLLPIVWLLFSPFQRSATFCSFLGWKGIFGYYGQMCHRYAHMRQRRLLHIMGLMISPEVHAVHHTSFNDNFCIGTGWSNPIIRHMRHITTNPNAWFSLLLFSIIVDVFLMSLIY
jgi:hypothetical protein